MNVYFVINVIIVTEPLTNAFYSNYIVPGVLSCIVCCINIIITLVQHHGFWCFTDILYWFYCICLFVCSTCLTSVILLVCEMAGSIPVLSQWTAILFIAGWHCTCGLVVWHSLVFLEWFDGKLKLCSLSNFWNCCIQHVKCYCPCG